MSLSVMSLSTALLSTALLSMEPAVAARAPQAADGVWTDFHWLDIDVNGHRFDRAIMLVDAAIDGLPGRHRLQFDTGAHRNILHGAAVADVRASFLPAAGREMRISGRMAGLTVSGEPFLIWPRYRAMLAPGRPLPIIGALGAPFLQSRVLVIDYPRARLGFFDGAAGVPPAIARAAQFVPIEYRDAKMYVPIEVAGERQAGVFFDSGASAFPLVLGQAEWERVTGRKPEDARNQRMLVPGWTKSSTFIGAPLAGALRLGPAVKQAPLVFFSPDAEFRFDAVPDVRGLIGNALFADRFAVIVDLPRRRLGLIASETLATLR